VALAGCGGGGGGGIDEDDAVGSTGITNGQAIARFTALNDGFVAVRRDQASQSDVPTSGNVTYSGSLGFDVSGAVPGGGNDVDASLVGDMTMNVNFQNSQIGGSVSNFLFADSDGNLTQPTGTLALSGDIADIARPNLPDLENNIRATATGQLAITRGTTTDDVNMALRLSGQFAGNPGATSATNPNSVQCFVVGEGTGDLTLNAPNGRFAGQLPGQTILP
jgi:hypothetical protein